MTPTCHYCAEPAGPQGFCAEHWASYQAFLAKRQPPAARTSLMDVAFAEMSASAAGLMALSVRGAA